jgi:Ca2+-transporting ATPase
LPTADTPYHALTKGAVDGLLEVCHQIWVEETIEPLEPFWRTRIEIANNEMAQKGMRVLGVAWRAWDDPTEVCEEDLVFVGLIGMIDPPRPEVKEAVAICKAAGIRPIMITGDHPLTARFIAQDLGVSDNDGVQTGQDLTLMSAAELDAMIDKVSVYARVSPEHKLRIVEALQRRGEIVAMTGDGVNDSPALRKADIGIAMGITGTDVSKEAADAVLLDDNFATIVAAVEEGRVIYDNIRRFVKFSIAGNLGKVLAMLLTPLFGVAVALLPLQLLWLNLLTDGLLGLGLSLEPAEAQTMKRPPRRPRASLFGEGVGWQVVWVGGLLGLVALGVGMWYYDPVTSAQGTWRTMMFTVLAFSQMGQALASRSSQALRFSPALIGMVLLTFALQLLVLYVPFLDDFFGVVPLSVTELLVCLMLASIVFAAIEVERRLRYRLYPSSAAS